MSDGDGLARARETARDWPGRPELMLADRLPSGAEATLVRVVDARGRRFVLKLGSPGRIAEELMALQALRGPAVVRVEDAWVEAGALLLEDVRPGLPLTAERDETVARVRFTAAMRRLGGHAPAGRFPSVAEWCAASVVFHDRLRQSHDVRAAIIGRWHAKAEKLLDTAPARALLHGDLHDGNLLKRDGDGYLAIDPKGVVGEAAYEPACFLMNRWRNRPDLSGPSMVQEAAALAADLGLRPGRVLGWAGSHTALSLGWSWEDDGDVPGASDPRWRILTRLEEGGSPEF